MKQQADTGAARLPWMPRLHQALMPDYNRSAAAYWWGMLALGLAAVLVAAGQIAQQTLDTQIQVALGCVVAAMAGFYPVRIPGSKNSFAAGEVFIFLLLLMHGPAAAVLAAAVEAFVGSMRSSKRWTSRLVSPALAAIAVAVTGSALHLALDQLQSRGWLNEALLLFAAMAFAAGYFLLNTALITIIPLIWIVATSFKTPPDSIAYPPKLLFTPSLEGYVNLFRTAADSTSCGSFALTIAACKASSRKLPPMTL